VFLHFPFFCVAMSDVELSPQLLAVVNEGSALLKQYTERDEAAATSIFNDVVLALGGGNDVKRIAKYGGPVSQLVYRMLVSAGVSVTPSTHDGFQCWECRRVAPAIEMALRIADDRFAEARAASTREARAHFEFFVDKLVRENSVSHTVQCDDVTTAILCDMCTRASFKVVRGHAFLCLLDKGKPCICKLTEWTVTR